LLRLKIYEQAHSIEKRKKGKSSLNGKIDMHTIYKDLATRVRLLKEAQLQKQKEKEKLLRKFFELQNIVKEVSKPNKSIDIIKAYNDRKVINKAIQEQDLALLIKDQSGFSDISLSEFAKLIIPDEKDMEGTLEELGLKHLIKRNKGMC